MAPKKGAGVQYDVIGEMADSVSIEVSSAMIRCLFQKGFCTADLSLDKDLVEKANAEARSLEGGRLEAPPKEIVDGLLGLEGSSEFGLIEPASSDGEPDGPGLLGVDAILEKVARGLTPMDEELGMTVDSRSTGMIHLAGEPKDDPPELTEIDCQKWLQTFLKHRLMIILFCGPSSGMLELQPFDHEDSPPLEVLVEAGTLVILRADCLTHRYTSSGKSTAISCWLNQETCLTELKLPTTASAVSKELKKWAMDKLSDLKVNQVIGEEGQEWDPAVPKEWQRVANKQFAVGPQVSVRGLSCKFPSTHLPECWGPAMTWGTDFVSEVPFLRWNHEEAYDARPGSWKWSRTAMKHAAFADGMELFDNKFFGISPAEARSMDPMQRHILETSYEAMLSCGYNKKKLMRTLIGVYIGGATSEFVYMPQTDASSGTGGSNSITSNRISFCLGMQGPSYTIDLQGASGLTALTQATLSMRLQTSQYAPNHTALFGATYLMIVPRLWVLADAQGWLSHQGRSFAFDSSAEGYTKGEGVSNGVLMPLSTSIDGQHVVDESLPVHAIIASAAQNHSGATASLTAPNGPQEKDMLFDCLRQGGLSGSDIDSVEAWAQASILADAVEVQVLKDALRGDDLETPLCISAVKSNVGMGMEADGLQMLLKVVSNLKLGVCSPTNHIIELNPHIEAWTGDEPMLFTTELTQYADTAAFQAMKSRSIAGCNATVIAFGNVDQDAHPPIPKVMPQSITFWPSGGGDMDTEAEPVSNKPYCIVGSWTGFQDAEAMKNEGNGVFSFEMALGHNRFESFQILLDGKGEKVLHPLFPKGASGTGTAGPNGSAESEGFNWVVDGRGGAEGGGGALALTTAAPTLRDVGRLPAPYQAKALPGTLYKICLRVAGKWRTVDWEKISEPDPKQPPPDDGSKYYLAGSFNNWSLEHEMLPVPGSGVPGIFKTDVKVNEVGGDFVVVRNKDWNQCFYPPKEEDKIGSKVLGPDERAGSFYWSLLAKPGDSFTVEFKRLVGTDGTDTREISWTRALRRPGA